MKKAKKAPTRKQLEAVSKSIPQHTCSNCGLFKGSKYALKEHKEDCYGRL